LDVGSGTCNCPGDINNLTEFKDAGNNLITVWCPTEEFVPLDIIMAD